MSSKGKKKLIRAVGYLRKSTRGKTTKGREKQEKSIPQQKQEIEKLIKSTHKIIAWYEDPGRSASKSKVVREGYDAILKRAEEKKDFQAVVVDNLDRLNRAPFDDTYTDIVTLKKNGLREIVTASSGTHDLMQGSGLYYLVALISANHEFSRQLSRRVSLARRNAAEQGKRTGGPDPFGMVSDGKGGLKHGDPKHVKIVRLIFDLFVNELYSLCAIASELNRRGIPSPREKDWYAFTVRETLKRKCYAGQFTYNEAPSGEFFHLDDEGEVVEADKVNGNGKIFLKKSKYKNPIIAAKLFEQAQKRLEVISTDRSRRKRIGYALTGVLICDHCGAPMHGAKPKNKIIYRCGTPTRKGASACRQYQIMEDKMLPFVLGLLMEELADIEKLLTSAPKELRQPRKQKKERQAELQEQRDKLAAQSKTATRNVMLQEDRATRKEMDSFLQEMKADLAKLDEELQTEESPVVGYTKDELGALRNWYNKFEEIGISIPVEGHTLVTSFHQDPGNSEPAVLADPRKVNNALLELGARVHLRWETTKVKSSTGNMRTRHTLANGRFRLGQKEGKLSKQVLECTANR